MIYQKFVMKQKEKTSELKRIILFSFISYLGGIFTPILTDVARMALKIPEQKKEISIQLTLQNYHGCCFSDTLLKIKKDCLK